MTLRARLALLPFIAWLTAGTAALPLHAGPSLLYELSTGKILYAEDQDDNWHPASLTKLMTAYVTFQALKSGKVTLETPLTYSEAALALPPSKIGLPVGSTVSVDLALQALIVKSANDIAMALAEGIGGSEAQFVDMMNATAQQLGMTRTVYRNPHGLPAPEQVTTARDLARLSSAVLRDFPEYAHYWSQTQMQIANIRIATHNGLFKSMEGADGMKTGFICDSGYNMVASATRDGVRLISIVLGEMSVADRNSRAQALIEHGYATIGWKALFGAKDTIASLAIPANAKDATSIRTSVVAIECNNRRVARAAAVVRKHAKARAKAAKVKTAEKAAEKPAATAPPAAAAKRPTTTAAGAQPRLAAPARPTVQPNGSAPTTPR